jgi:hypothetical protein
MPSDGSDREVAVEADGSPPVSAAPIAPHVTDPVELTATFVAAVAWGEHLRVWELLSPEARRVVLRVAVGRGMDEALAARLRDGTAARAERDTFLTDLVNGLRADLRGNDLDALDYQPDPDPGGEIVDPDRTRVMLLAPLVSATLGAPLPVASVELVRDRGQWRVEHLLPRART